jgi:hypothetical protein
VALRVVAATLALSTLATLGALGSDPTPAAAGGSCTGWTSRIVPPRTIRVLRTQTGRVEKVGFRRYVAEVMASGEWPGRLHMTTLEAGAVATKQYAWYYAMKGHHRSGYRRGGRCYDVRDDTMDQLYRPARATPGARQLRAIETTWGLTLRKNGRFFLTGYRAGTTSRCAADANGWKLFARSLQACARRGWSLARVQRAYLDPNLSFVWAARIGPPVRKPNVWLRAGNTLPGKSTTVSWKPRRSSRVAGYVLQKRIGQGDWRRVDLSSRTARRADVRIRLGSAVRFRVRAVDEKGRRGQWAYSGRRKPSIRGDRDRVLVDVVPASGERPRSRLRFRGRSIGLIARTGPTMGTAGIFLDGRRIATVDLSRPAAHGRRLVWSRSFEHVRRRRVTVVATEGRVEVRGFLVLR